MTTPNTPGEMKISVNLKERIVTLHCIDTSGNKCEINLEPTSAFVIGQTMKRYADKLILAGRKGPA